MYIINSISNFYCSECLAWLQHVNRGTVARWHCDAKNVCFCVQQQKWQQKHCNILSNGSWSFFLVFLCTFASQRSEYRKISFVVLPFISFHLLLLGSFGLISPRENLFSILWYTILVLHISLDDNNTTHLKQDRSQLKIIQ